MPAATRIVQNTLETPKPRTPLPGRQVSIRLNTPAFTDGGAVEKARTFYATTDETGTWSVELAVNADIDPAGSSYTVAELPGVIWTFVVPVGDPAVPVTLRDCLVDAPTNPSPMTAGVSQAQLDTAIAALPAVAANSTLTALASLGTEPAGARQLYVADILRNFRRGAPTEGWQLVDGAYVIPWQWYDPNNLLTLGTKLRALLVAQKLYLFTRTGRVATGTTPGYPKAQSGLGLELMFPNIGEIRFQPDAAAYPDIALPFKQPWFRLENGVALRGNKGGTTLVAYMTTSQYGISTSYRPYPETPLRGGDLDITKRGSSANFTTAERALYVSGGTGQASTSAWPASGVQQVDTWVYRDTCRAVIDADVAAGSFTCHVTFAGDGGVETAWYAARSLTPTTRKLNNKIRVGCRVRRPQGMNPFDSHETKYADLPMVVAINGNTTAGYTTTGAATITFDRPFALDVKLANEFSAFPVGRGTQAVYSYLPSGSGGVENIESHALIAVDETLLCTNPYIGDITMVSDPTATQKPQSMFSFQSCIRPVGENLGGFDAAQQIVDINGAHGAVIRGLTHYGAVGTPVLNTGMAFDATSARNVRIEDLDVRAFPGTLAQAESYSSIVVHGGRIINDHPVVSAAPWFLLSGDSTIELEGQWLLEGRGGLMQRRGSSDVTQSAFKMRGRYTIVETDPANRTKQRLVDFDPNASIDYDGFNLAGTARLRRQFDTAEWQDRQAVKCTTGTTSINIPIGMLVDGWLRAPASLANCTSVKLLTNGRCNPVNLLGQTSTHLTCPATDSVGDGVGSTADRTFTCDPSFVAEIALAAEDATVRISAYNPDGSDWISSVQSLVLTTGTITGFVSTTLPPKPVTTGTSVVVGDLIIPGKKIRLTSQATSLWYGISATTGLPSTSSYNLAKLEAEDAGERFTFSVTYTGAPADPTDTFSIRVRTRQLNVKQGLAMVSGSGPAVLAGERRDGTALANLIAMLVSKDELRDATTDTWMPPTVLAAQTFANTSNDSLLGASPAITPKVGQVFRIEVDGNCDGITTSGLFNLKVKINGVLGTLVAALAVCNSFTAAQTNKTWSYTGLLFVDAIGASGQVTLGSRYFNRVAAATQQPVAQQDVATVDLSGGSLVISLVEGMQTANAGNVFRMTRAVITQVA